MVFVTKNEEETKKLAEKIASDILNSKEKNKGAFVVALEGVLGAGKTTFAKGFAKGLGVLEKETSSPTFVILQEYDLKKTSKFKKFYHVDCYRLKNENDVEDIGLSEVINDPENIVLIEWAGKIKNKIPKDAKKIKLYYISENKRKICMLN